MRAAIVRDELDGQEEFLQLVLPAKKSTKCLIFSKYVRTHFYHISAHYHSKTQPEMCFHSGVMSSMTYLQVGIPWWGRGSFCPENCRTFWPPRGYRPLPGCPAQHGCDQPRRQTGMLRYEVKDIRRHTAWAVLPALFPACPLSEGSSLHRHDQCLFSAPDEPRVEDNQPITD